MNDELQSQIYSSFNHKSTDELVELWITNDRVEWSDTAFKIMKDILEQRLGDVPVQNEPILEHIKQEKSKFYYREFPVNLIKNPDNPPIFYQPKSVLWIGYWLDKIAKVYIPYIILSNGLYLTSSNQTFLSLLGNKPELNFLAWVITIIYFIIIVSLQCMFYYYCLQALRYILRILMEIEFKSREALEKQVDL